MVDQSKVLALIPKVPGALSIIGSACIIYEVVKDRSKWKKPYHRLLCSMCLSDFFAAWSCFLSTWPIPTSSSRWGASGTEATCTAQGFFIQANICSPIYNFYLSLFFLLKVRYGYTDTRISTWIEPFMHISAHGFGLGTAFTALGLDMYHDSSLWCWVNASPYGCKQTFQYGYTTCVAGDGAGIFRWACFFGILWACILGTMITMGMLYHYVRQTEKKTRAYDFELAQAKKLAQQYPDEKNEKNSISEKDGMEHSNSYHSLGSMKRSNSNQSVSSAKRSNSNNSISSVESIMQGVASAAHNIKKHTKNLLQRRKDQRKEYQQSRIVARQSYRYCSVLYIAWAFASVNRLLQLVRGESFFWVLCLHAFFAPLQGVLNCVYMYPKWEAKRLEQRKKAKNQIDNKTYQPHQRSPGKRSSLIRQISIFALSTRKSGRSSVRKSRLGFISSREETNKTTTQQSMDVTDRQQHEQASSCVVEKVASVPAIEEPLSDVPEMMTDSVELVVSAESDISDEGDEEAKKEETVPKLPRKSLDLSIDLDDDDNDDNNIRSLAYSTEFL